MTEDTTIPTASSPDDHDEDSSSVEVILDAQAVAMFPPRPDAIVTLLHSDDYLPGVQTLLYSIRKKFAFHQLSYPPEVVVLATPNVNIPNAHEVLFPTFCTRILEIDYWDPPVNSIDSKLMTGGKLIHRTLDNHNPGWTKLRIFSLQQYETILYIDSDCLVLKDLSHLISLNKKYTISENLIAAAPDLLPPHNFNTGVMVVRPSTKVFDTMQRNSSFLMSYGSDTGFLNAYYPNWFTEFPPDARLSVGYNAQTALYDMTADSTGTSIFWDAQLSHELHIVHYSEAVKPWQVASSTSQSSPSSKNALHALWKSWYQKSKNFLARDRKERAKQEQERQEVIQKQQRERQAAAAALASDPKHIHKLVTKRYKELRAQGKSTKLAMEQARTELQPEQNVDPGSQVAAMFGMR